MTIEIPDDDQLACKGQSVPAVLVKQLRCIVLNEARERSQGKYSVRKFLELVLDEKGKGCGFIVTEVVRGECVDGANTVRNVTFFPALDPAFARFHRDFFDGLNTHMTPDLPFLLSLCD